jgi:MSHA biogenesis protein MshK
MKITGKGEGERGKGMLRIFIFAACGLLLPVFAGAAEELVDPTRPPASIAAPVAEADVVIPAAGLQSIIIGKKRRAAIIDGQTVELGGRVGDAKLVEVNTASVVMRTKQGRQVLKLFPDVTITSSKSNVSPVQIHKKAASGERK